MTSIGAIDKFFPGTCVRMQQPNILQLRDNLLQNKTHSTL